MKIGDKLRGVITGIKPYGAFVSLENGTTGLIHISEIKTGYIDNIYNTLKVDQEVLVQVVDFDEFTQKASLSLRTLEEEKNKIPHRHRFSDSRLNYGFKPLAEAMPGWIEEGLDYLRQEHEEKQQKLTLDESAFFGVFDLATNKKIFNLIEDPCLLIRHQNRAILLVCV